MKVGDIVTGLPESDRQYGLTNSTMTRGLVMSVSDSTQKATIKIIAAKDFNPADVVYTNRYLVDCKYLRVVGHVRPVELTVISRILKSKNKMRIFEYDLRDANFHRMSLRDLDFSGMDLSTVHFESAQLNNVIFDYADLSYCRFFNAQLKNVSFCNANLLGAGFIGASFENCNLDFSTFPLFCGGLDWKVDARIVRQQAYHLCSMKCDDPEFAEVRKNLLSFANKFHRVVEHKDCKELS